MIVSNLHALDSLEMKIFLSIQKKKWNVEFNSLLEILVLESRPEVGNDVIDVIQADKEVCDIVPIGKSISHDHNQVTFTQGCKNRLTLANMCIGVKRLIG